MYPINKSNILTYTNVQRSKLQNLKLQHLFFQLQHVWPIGVQKINASVSTSLFKACCTTSSFNIVYKIQHAAERSYLKSAGNTEHRACREERRPRVRAGKINVQVSPPDARFSSRVLSVAEKYIWTLLRSKHLRYQNAKVSVHKTCSWKWLSCTNKIQIITRCFFGGKNVWTLHCNI